MSLLRSAKLATLGDGASSCLAEPQEAEHRATARAASENASPLRIRPMLAARVRVKLEVATDVVVPVTALVAPRPDLEPDPLPVGPQLADEDRVDLAERVLRADVDPDRSVGQRPAGRRARAGRRAATALCPRPWA